MDSSSYANQHQNMSIQTRPKQSLSPFINQPLQLAIPDANLEKSALYDFNNDWTWSDRASFETQGQTEVENIDREPSPSIHFEFQLSPWSSSAARSSCLQFLSASPRSSEGSSPLILDQTSRLDRRRAQNRASQRAFRLRKEKRISDASRKVAELEQKIVAMGDSSVLIERIAFLEQQISVLEAENAFLQCQVAQPHYWQNH